MKMPCFCNASSCARIVYACNSLVYILYSYFEYDSKGCKQLECTRVGESFACQIFALFHLNCYYILLKEKLCRSQFYLSGSVRPSTSFKLRVRIFCKTKLMYGRTHKVLKKGRRWKAPQIELYTLLWNMVEKRSEGDYNWLQNVLCDRCIQSSLPFFPAMFWSRVALGCFTSLPCFHTLYRSYVTNFYRKLLPLVSFIFCVLQVCKSYGAI